MSTPPIVTQYGGPTPYKLRNVDTAIGSNIYSQFYPYQISDLAIWLDGKDILNNLSNNPADGSSLAGWSNKAPNIITVTQPNPLLQPTFNSLTGVVFTNDNGTAFNVKNGFQTTYGSDYQNETIFILLDMKFTQNNYNILYPINPLGGRQLYLSNTVGSTSVLITARHLEEPFDDENLLASGGVIRESPTLITTRNNTDGNIYHYINGLVSGSMNNVTRYGNGGNTFIGTDNYGFNGFDGTISEIIIYSNALSDNDRLKVESYLYWKWNTFTLFPSNPYTTQAYSNIIYRTTMFYSYFYPNQISNLALWLDGKDIDNSQTIPENGTFIDNWYNKASNDISVTQGIEEYRPKFDSLTNGVFFDNSGANVNGFNTNYSSRIVNETVFILLSNSISTKNRNNIFYPEFIGGRQLYLLSNNSSENRLITGKRLDDDILVSGTVKNSAPTLITTLINNNSVIHYINGLLSGTSNISPTTGGATYIGSDNYGTSGFTGSICEIIVYSNVLSDSERQKVESYLYWKWLSFPLNSGNPYKTQGYSNYLYPNINSNVIPPVPRNLYSGLPGLNSNNYPLINNFNKPPYTLRNVMF